VQNGEEWMKPLLNLRNKLAETTVIEDKGKYRSHIRRDGRMAFKTLVVDGKKEMTEGYTYGPYLLSFRQQFLKELLETQKQINVISKDTELVTVPELHAIRHQWLNDPNEPDWEDTLPKIFNDVFGYDLDWSVDDTNQFSHEEAKLLNDISPRYAVAPQMIKKLIDLETSMSGLSRRTGIFNKIGKLVQQDWESPEEIIGKNLESRQNQMRQSKEVISISEELEQLNKLIEKEELL
jgi:DNA sulfur modification protein DndC